MTTTTTPETITVKGTTYTAHTVTVYDNSDNFEGSSEHQAHLVELAKAELAAEGIALRTWKVTRWLGDYTREIEVTVWAR